MMIIAIVYAILQLMLQNIAQIEGTKYLIPLNANVSKIMELGVLVISRVMMYFLPQDVAKELYKTGLVLTHQILHKALI